MIHKLIVTITREREMGIWFPCTEDASRRRATGIQYEPCWKTLVNLGIVFQNLFLFLHLNGNGIYKTIHTFDSDFEA